ncbi:MAG: beta-lactamase family protein [Acidobacteria bacterium]|nr:beta-lactamase family protein [Acidobacteriota bacterium]MBV9069510.1 beta-lactamase family protein [Acidobacteriota bacterium]MBV9186513.1 beta-lactamase family protein [Acidobacteriota bacterium]
MRKTVIAFVAIAAVTAVLHAQELPADMRASIDKAAADILAKTGAPSASVAVVRDGKIVYEHAYGLANLETKMPASPQMRYSIGSISKQFTAAALLMLAEEGKLSLDDKVIRWLPDLTRAGDVTIRQMLSMTSGYQDFWPQDYVMPMMMQPVTAPEIAAGWAKKPLDFEPGAKWQYSNTNYVIAGMIAEKVAGMPLLDYLQKRVFVPLHMTTVSNTDAAPLGPEDPMRYLRYALGPLRRAPKEGQGWMFAAGELAMTAHDLALWDISMIDQTILKPSSYRAMETEVELNNGVGSRYGLGVGIGVADGRRVISHGGEVSGFTARNEVYPDDRVAIVVLTNMDATSTPAQIATSISKTIFASNDPATPKTTDQMRKIFDELQKGHIDRTQFTSNANAYFDEQAIKDFAASLGPLGTPQEFVQSGQSLRGGMTLRRYRIKFPTKTLALTTFIMPDGKIEQYQIAAAE